jgi:hypothetical protein
VSNCSETDEVEESFQGSLVFLNHYPENQNQEESKKEKKEKEKGRQMTKRNSRCRILWQACIKDYLPIVFQLAKGLQFVSLFKPLSYILKNLSSISRH